MNPRRRDLKIAVLASGYSRRLGFDKLLATVHGVSLLRRTLQTVRAAADAEVLVIVPRNSARLRHEARGMDVRLVHNLARGQGMSSSVKLAVRCARRSGALLLMPADLVQLRASDLRRLIACWRSSRHLVCAADTAPRGGAPLVLPQCHFERADALEGDVGLRAVVSQLAAGSVRVVAMLTAHADVDNGQQLLAARRDLRRR